MIFFVQFGINKHLKKHFEKFTRAYLFQIALEIMRLPILNETYYKASHELSFIVIHSKYFRALSNMNLTSMNRWR